MSDYKGLGNFAMRLERYRASLDRSAQMIPELRILVKV